MSVDRIEHLLGIMGSVSSTNDNRQIVFPEVSFTCTGTIKSWIFGGGWVDGARVDSLPELQIWRLHNDGSFTKVGSTSLAVTKNNTTRLYQHQLSSPLPFQAGDVLGYFQPNSQLKVLFEINGRGRTLSYDMSSSTPPPVFSINSQSGERIHQIILYPVTGILTALHSPM